MEGFSMKIPIKKILLIASIGILTVGFIFLFMFNVILAPCTETHFQIEVNEPFGVWGQNGTQIDVVMYQPKPENDFYASSRPVVVMQHGFSCDKTYMKGAAYELCKRGFVAVSISARGHGASGGLFASAVYFYNETLGVVAWLRNYSAEYKLDISRIGLAGHSMGAVTVTNAAIMDHEHGLYWINSTVAISGPLFNYTAGDPGRVKDYDFPNTFAFNYPLNPYDIQGAMDESIIEGRVNASRPSNYCNINGQYDEAFTPLSARQVVWNMGGPTVFGVGSYAELPSSVTYGNFTNGTARRLVIVPGIEHVMEMHDTTVLTEMIQWFESSMNITNSNAIVITEPLRMTGILLVILGIATSIFPFAAYLGGALKKDDTPKPEAAKNIESKNMFQLFGVYAGIYVATAIPVFPIILTFNLQLFITPDFLMSNIFILFTFVHCLFLLPALIALLIFERKKYDEKLEDFGLARKSMLPSVIFGLTLFIIYFILGNASASNNFHNMMPYKIQGFIEILAYLLVIIFITEMFRNLIQNKLSRYEGEKLWKIPGKSHILTIVIPGLIQGISVGIIFFMYNLYLGDIISGLTELITYAGIFMALSALQYALYTKMENVLAPTIFLAFFLAWIFSIIMPAVNTGLIFVFFS